MWMLLHIQSNHLIYCLQLIKRTDNRTKQPKHKTVETEIIPNRKERDHDPKPVCDHGLHNRRVSMTSIYLPNLVCVPDSFFPIYV
jgi:hypothetical protein